MYVVLSSHYQNIAIPRLIAVNIHIIFIIFKAFSFNVYRPNVKTAAVINLPHEVKINTRQSIFNLFTMRTAKTFIIYSLCLEEKSNEQAYVCTSSSSSSSSSNFRTFL